MRIKVGYLRNLYEQCGALVAATIRSEGSLLLAGSTGSGKTTLLWLILYELIQTLEPDTLLLDICDYKYEYRALYGCPRYHFEVDDIIAAIDRHYEAMYHSRGKPGNHILHCLVMDEYLSFMSYLEAMAKSDKKYKEAYQRVSMEITSILAMGRSLGYTLICIVQQANAKSFSSTADRENFINKIAMGTQTSISAGMIFDSADTDGLDYKKPMPVGCGFLSVQGEGIKEIIVPRITNPETMKQRIRVFLDNEHWPNAP
jgi:energy-coupling factor transporter ATP-binding protein EcfA2